MARGGARPGAGRKAGAITKRTRQIAAKAAAEGISPLEYILGVMRNEENALPVRLDAAKSAAPYIHPRLAAIEHTGPDGGPIEHVTTTMTAKEAAEAYASTLDG